MKILIADDHALFREGMRFSLENLGDAVTLFEADNFQDALAAAESNPDLALVLMDLNMPGSMGPLSVQAFHARFPGISVVVISGSDQRDDIEQVLNFGAMGFISKKSTAKSLLHALRMVLDGEVYIPPQMLQQAVPNVQDKGRGGANDKRLTKRQMEVLLHLSKGLTNKSIANVMGLSEGTVKIHLASIFQILGASNRVEALQIAARHGLLADS